MKVVRKLHILLSIVVLLSCKTVNAGTVSKQDDDLCQTQNPCLNGGTCINPSPDVHSCVCYTGFSGENCQLVDLCVAASPCQNGGVCRASNGSFQCECTNGYSGYNCEVVDLCISNNPCENGGTCRNVSNGYECTCLNGYHGKNCDVIDICVAANPCINGGTCQLLDDSYLCICEPNFNGTNCENAHETETQQQWNSVRDNLMLGSSFAVGEPGIHDVLLARIEHYVEDTTAGRVASSSTYRGGIVNAAQLIDLRADRNSGEVWIDNFQVGQSGLVVQTNSDFDRALHWEFYIYGQQE